MKEDYKECKDLFERAFRKTNDYKFYIENDMSDAQIFSKKNGKYECYPVRQAYIVWCQAMKIVNELDESLEALKKKYQYNVLESWGEDN